MSSVGLVITAMLVLAGGWYRWQHEPAPVTQTPAIAQKVVAGRVVGVHDGDTITVLVVQREVKVRFYGIDAPELGQAFGKNAKQALSDLVFGKDVIVEIVDTDRYKRSVGRVFVGETFVNVEMVRAGFAWWYRSYARNDRDLEAAENSARAARLGLWQDEKPVPPWEWRKREAGERLAK